MSQPENTGRRNNVGLLRLLFAAMVVVSHSAELVDGTNDREVLMRLFGTMSFGSVAVDGFFIISGYLITRSFVQARDVPSYLVRRVLRILPAYLISFWICAVLIAPLTGTHQFVLAWPQLKYDVVRSVLLLPPDIAGSFPGLPFPILDGAVWTIAYEFRCYLAVALLGLLGRTLRLNVHAVRWVLVILVGVGLFTNAIGFWHDTPALHPSIFGTTEANVRFFSTFGVGVLFYLFDDEIPLTTKGAWAAAAIMLVGLIDPRTAEAAFAVAGGYLIFWFALRFMPLRTRIADERTDISYGLYLYAWPLQNLIIWHDRTIDPWALCLVTLVGAGLAGYASWTFIEKNAIALAHGPWRGSAPRAAAPRRPVPVPRVDGEDRAKAAGDVPPT